MNPPTRLLLLDPDPARRAALRKTLPALELRCVDTPVQALQALRSASPWAALLITSNLADPTFIEALREEHPLFTLPILLLDMPRERALTLLRVGANAAVSTCGDAVRQQLLRWSPPLHATPEPRPFACDTCQSAVPRHDRPCPFCAAPPPHGPPPAHYPHLGRVLASRYRLEQPLGLGAFGAVYRASDAATPLQSVALKLLHPDPHTPARELRRRIEREAQALLCLRSPHVVPILNLLHLADLPGQPFALVMDFVEGEALSARLERDGPLDPALAFAAFAQIAHALADAHSLGLIHRDLKPDNILLRGNAADDAFAALLDFGLVDLPQRAAAAGTPPPLHASPFWAAPELLSPDARPIDHRADLYALGASLYHALTGHPPYPGPSPTALMAQHRKAPLPTLNSPAEPLLHALLAKRPQDRPDSAAEVARRLRQLMGSRGEPPRTPILRGAPLALLRRDVYT